MNKLKTILAAAGLAATLNCSSWDKTEDSEIETITLPKGCQEVLSSSVAYGLTWRYYNLTCKDAKSERVFFYAYRGHLQSDFTWKEYCLVPYESVEAKKEQ